MSSLLVFNKVYRLERQSVMVGIFDPPCELATDLLDGWKIYLTADCPYGSKTI